MAAYYNEIDPYAAQWLRNLIAAGHIAPGDVDERSISEISAGDLKGYTQCHFFAGIGVWSHALRRAGFSDDMPVWTGSCPCQPFSAAGKQKGFDDERHLWPVWFGLIGQCNPSIVLGEQVASALDWLDLVSADMEGAGYAFGASDLCAAGFGGAHIRQRLYFVGVGNADNARPQGHGRLGKVDVSQGREAAGRYSAEAGVVGGLADTDQQRCSGQHSLLWAEESGRDASAIQQVAWGRSTGGVADTAPEQHDWSGGAGARGWLEHPDGGGTGGLADPESAGRGVRHAENQRSPDAQSHAFADAGDSTVDGQQRSPAERPDAPMLGRNPADWLYCRDGKWRPVEPGTFPLVDAAPARVGRLRAYGNALDAETASQFCGAVLDVLDLAALMEQF